MRALTLAPVLILLGGSPAAGQATVPGTRADLQGTIAWQNIREPQPQGSYSSNDWINAICAGEAAGSWYWSEHLRTTFDAGVNTRGQQYWSSSTITNGFQTYRSTRLMVDQWQLGIGQQYQFGHNAWFHPHVGGGALIVQQQRTEDVQPVVVYSTGKAITYEPGHIDRTDSTFVRPFVDVGFKAYVSRKAYFVHDTRLTVGSNGIEQVTLKIGFGVDFW